jgi:hypothetical protein
MSKAISVAEHSVLREFMESSFGHTRVSGDLLLEETVVASLGGTASMAVSRSDKMFHHVRAIKNFCRQLQSRVRV